MPHKRLIKCVNCDELTWSQKAYKRYYCSKKCFEELRYWYDHYLEIVEGEQNERVKEEKK